MRYTLTRCATGLVAAVLFSCGSLRPATVPIRSIVLASGGSGRCLAVLLPGRYAAPENFIGGRFGEAVRARGLDMDVIALDAHLGYYRTGAIVERIREDVVFPARARGYKEIWIAGTSLGGLGGLLYLHDHPEDLSGVLAIAPYLGEDDLIREIEAAGGPRNWKAPSEIAPNDVGRNLWSWLGSGQVVNGAIPISLGWGTSDPFDRSNRLLASMLPPERTFPVPGGHDMKTWNAVWSQFLDRVAPCRK